MIIISEEFKSSVKDIRYKVYSKHMLTDGEECFNSNESFDTDLFYITNVPVSNIRYINGKFYYTKEDYRKAQYYLRQVVAINPNDSSIRKLNEALTKLMQ